MSAMRSLQKEFNQQVELSPVATPHECRPFCQNDIGRLIVWWVEYKPEFLVRVAEAENIAPDTKDAPQRIVRAYLDRQAKEASPDMALSFIPDRIKNWYEGPHAHLEQVSKDIRVLTFIEPDSGINLAALPFPQA